MELRDLSEKVLALFGVSGFGEMGDAMMRCVLARDEAVYSAFTDLVGGDLSRDWVRALYQFYLADREGLKQDYTPPSLARLVDALAGDSDVTVDLCAGSGALSVQRWIARGRGRFVCRELDGGVVPFLLFNMAVRGMTGVVHVGDSLSDDEPAAVYSVRGDGARSAVAVGVDDSFGWGDGVSVSMVSNPPFNVRWRPPSDSSGIDLFAESAAKPRLTFLDFWIPDASNANLAFVLTGLDMVTGRAVFVLPCGALSDDGGAGIRGRLVEAGLVEAVVACPDNMFDGTGVPVSLLVLNRGKAFDGVMMVDARGLGVEEVRKKRGEYGGASHERRHYVKTVTAFTDEEIARVAAACRGGVDVDGLARLVGTGEVASHGWNLTPGRYGVRKADEVPSRPLADIVADLNRVTLEKNLCKLTVNETLARGVLGMGDLIGDMARQAEDERAASWGMVEKITGCRIVRDDYLAFTKNGGVVTFSNGSKDGVSSVLVFTLGMWKQHVYFLNNEQNRYLAELRDALLPKLMSGEIGLADVGEGG